MLSAKPFSLVGDESRFRWTVGGMHLRLRGLDGWVDSAVTDAVVRLAAELDGRQAIKGEMGLEESGAFLGVRSALGEEYWLHVNDIAPVGPGGRVTYYRSARSLEVAFHARGRSLRGRWRNPRTVAREALAAFGGELISGERLRAAFGYYEAAGYEPQDLMRPVYVVLVDQHSDGENPGWRLASVHAATDLDDTPPTAGIESVTGCA
ncbi:hypothetical protein [Lentzea sp. NPDC051838]|uniref:hypothetical protein n=1 Tax=Lentzea sp. NPDC051838 TaxID=3154849 RepID=UPI00341F9A2A